MTLMETRGSRPASVMCEGLMWKKKTLRALRARGANRVHPVIRGSYAASSTIVEYMQEQGGAEVAVQAGKDSKVGAQPAQRLQLVVPDSSSFQPSGDRPLMAFSRRISRNVLAMARYLRGGYQVSGSAHSFWSGQTLPFLSSNVLTSVTPGDLLCVLATLLIIAVIFLTISLLVGHSSGTPTYQRKAYAILKGSVTLEGVIVLADGIEVRAFLGVPYAQLPGRFQQSHRIEKAARSVIDATHTGPACRQERALPHIDKASEDCLNLNVWTPNIRCDEPVAACRNKTVLFFLHGGFFQVGSNSDYYYDGRFLSAIGNLVVVVPNYRLGVFGFLNYGTTGATANVGLRDQLLALVWVRENIADLGGDISNIVLIGHESGAASVGYHLRTAQESLQVKRAVLLSGSPLARYPDDTNRSEAMVERLAETLSCPRPMGQALACLMALPAAALSDAAKIYFFPTSARCMVTSHIPGHNETQVEDMDVMLGSVANEGGPLSSLYLRYLTWKYLDVESDPISTTSNVLQRMGFDQRAAPEIAESYIAGFGGSREFWLQDLFADVLVVCPVQYYAEYLVSAGNRVYAYYGFCQNASRANDMKHQYVTDHLFGFHRLQSREDQALSLEIIRFFADFVSGGDVVLPKTVISAGCRLVVGSYGQTSDFEHRRKQCAYLKPYYL